MHSKLLQEHVLNSVLKRFRNKAQAVKALSDLLGLGRDAVYRRFNGETELAIDQLITIAKTFEISIDQLIFNPSQSFLFRHNALPEGVKTFEQYMESIGGQMEKFGRLPNLHAYIASSEIPIFWYLFFPRLLCFKLYMTGLTIWDFKHMKDLKFNFDLLSPAAKAMAFKMAKIYLSMPSNDFWTTSIIDNTLSQVEYLVETQRFENRSDATVVCNELSQLIRHTRQMAESGTKFFPGEQQNDGEKIFNLYLNEMTATNNTILGVFDGGRVLFVTIQHPNFMHSADPSLCSMMESWFKEVMSHSTLISHVSSRRRNWYFNHLEEKIRLTKQKIQLYR